MLRSLLVAGAASALVTTAAQAASLTVTLDPEAEDTGAGGVKEDPYDRKAYSLFALDYDRSLDAADGSSSGSVAVTADHESGAITVDGSIVVGGTDTGVTRADAATTINILEQFTATGSGSVFFTLEVDGQMITDDGLGFGPIGGFWQAYLQTYQSGEFPELQTDSGRVGLWGGNYYPTTSAADLILRSTYDVDGALDLIMSMSWVANVAGSQRPNIQQENRDLAAFYDFDLRLCYGTTGTVEVSFLQSDFLSDCGGSNGPGDPGDPGDDTSVVPLPAGLPLVLTALGALGVLRRRARG